ncbi:MAG: efflux RND transporter periplasmic adaptor subunit, partial [Nitrospira sp.]
MKALFGSRRAASKCLSRGVSGLLFGLMVLESGCDGTPSDVVASKSPVAVSAPGRITLSAEESSRVGVVVQPVARSDFRTHRDFPAIVQPNQRNMAEITALVRGRVVEVYGELGQEVKGNAPLAILYSSDLGLAQSAYLKAKAKLHVAEQAFERAQFLLQEQVIGEAELQRRQAELLSNQAEANESHDRLKLLGMNDEEFRRLESSRKIRSVVPLVAPFAGRIIVRKLTRGEVVETT